MADQEATAEGQPTADRQDSAPTPVAVAQLMLGELTSQRTHVLGILDGLSEEDLRRPVLPSGWSCLGLVQHLALDVEQFWFRRVMAGEAIDDPDDAWHVPADVGADAVLDGYRREIERADAIARSTSLDAPPAWWPADLFGSWRMDNLREVILHVTTETACHAGHLDVVRELIDGRTWLVLT